MKNKNQEQKKKTDLQQVEPILRIILNDHRRRTKNLNKKNNKITNQIRTKK